MANKHVLPFCVCVIHQNRTQIIQAAISNIFLNFQFQVLSSFLYFAIRMAGSSFFVFFDIY